MTNFSINKDTGIVTPLAPLDYEKLTGPNLGNVRPLHFIVQARDMGSPSLWSEVPLIIYLQDVNDHEPIFDQAFYNRTIPEDVPGGTSILEVSAYDDDGSNPNNEIVYRIQSGASDKFVIGSDTGIISVAQGASLDPDLTEPQQMRYTLNVLAIDGGLGDSQLQASVLVNITILDVNNKPPYYLDPGIIQIRENTPVGTEVYELIAKDPDSNPILRYHIDHQNSEARNEDGALIKIGDYDFISMFDLNPMTGMLKIAKLIDRERIEVIRLGLIVEDLGAIGKPQIGTCKYLRHVLKLINKNSDAQGVGGKN